MLKALISRVLVVQARRTEKIALLDTQEVDSADIILDQRRLFEGVLERTGGVSSDLFV